MEPGVIASDEHAEWKESERGQRLVAPEPSVGTRPSGKCCVVFSLIGDLRMLPAGTELAGYRNVHRGGRQLANECISLPRLWTGGTGIGEFFDEEVNDIWLHPSIGQSR